jgi:Zn-dependent protease
LALQDISLFHGAAWYFVFLFSTTLHEASHAYSAFKLGDDTAHRGGQTTLDPTPHIRREPFGMVIVPILSYILGGWMIGWASAPYDPIWANRHPRRAALMSMAGPFSNLALVILAAILIRAGIYFGYFTEPDRINFHQIVTASREGIPYLLSVLLSITFSLNLLLFLFNLFPLPPLDGASIPLFFLSERAAEKYWEFLSSPAVSFMGFIIAWKTFGFIYYPVHHFAIDLLYPGANYG